MYDFSIGATGSLTASERFEGIRFALEGELVDSLDRLYDAMIARLVTLIGREEAYRILSEETMKRCDSTIRQALSSEGAFAQEVAQILKENPGWNIFFENAEGRFSMRASIPDESLEDGELQSQVQRIKDAFERYKQIRHPDVQMSITTQKVTKEVDKSFNTPGRAATRGRGVGSWIAP